MPYIGTYENSDDLIQAFKKGCDVSHVTSENYAFYVKLLLEFLDVCAISYQEFDKEDLASFIDDLGKRYAKGTAKQARPAIKAFYRWLEAEGICEDAAGRVGKKGAHGKLSRRRTKSPKRRPDPEGDYIAKIKPPPGRPMGRLGIIDSELVDAYGRERELTGKTARAYCCGIRAYSRYLEDMEIAFDEVTAETLEEYAEWVRREYAESTSCQMLSSIRSFYGWLEEKGYYENVAKSLRVRRKKKTLHRQPLTVEQARRVIEVADELPNTEAALRSKVIVKLTIVSALWPHEIRDACVGDVSFSDSFAAMFVKASSRRPDSLVYLPKSVARDLRRYLEFRNAPSRAPLVSSVAPASYGCRISVLTISNAINDVMEKAGIQGVLGGYSLRRTAVELARASGATHEQVVQLARWQSLVAIYDFRNAGTESDGHIQDDIERILTAEGDGKTRRIVRAGEIRSMVEHLDDDDLVVASFGDDGRLRIDALENIGS